MSIYVSIPYLFILLPGSLFPLNGDYKLAKLQKRKASKTTARVKSETGKRHKEEQIKTKMSDENKSTRMSVNLSHNFVTFNTIFLY